MTKRIALASAALVALALGAQAQTLEIGFDQSPAGLDPHIATAFATFAVINGTIYEGLTAVDKDLRVQPGLAESWTVADAGRTYVFKLRGNVKFHDGAAMEAEDVVASINRVLNKDIGSPLASRLAAVESARAVDAGTVEIKLKERRRRSWSRSRRSPSFRAACRPTRTRCRSSRWAPGRSASPSGSPTASSASPSMAATGGRDSRSSTASSSTSCRNRRRDRSGSRAAPTRCCPTSTPRRRCSSGQAEREDQETLELAYTLVGFNTSKPPFDNPKVREAVNYALNRAEIVQAAQFGKGVPGGPLSPALKDWAVDTKEFPCYAHDPAKARALLKEAGVAEPVTVTMNVLPRQDIKDIAQVVQAQLNKAGFKVELKNQELGQFIQDWRNSNFDMFASTNAGSPDPDDYFFRTFRTGGSTNVFKYTNPKIDELLDKARAAGDAAQRKAMYAEVQKTLACDGPIAHLTYGQLFSAMRTNVQGYEIMANRSLSYLRDASVR
jgi:peptide/nickel transport system substrate-binding protein